MKKFFIAVCVLATVFDGFATALGLCVAAKVRTFPGYLFSSVEALIVIALMVSTRDSYPCDVFCNLSGVSARLPG